MFFERSLTGLNGSIVKLSATPFYGVAVFLYILLFGFGIFVPPLLGVLAKLLRYLRSCIKRL